MSNSSGGKFAWESSKTGTASAAPDDWPATRAEASTKEEIDEWQATRAQSNRTAPDEWQAPTNASRNVEEWQPTRATRPSPAGPVESPDAWASARGHPAPGDQIQRTEDRHVRE